jgi:hypothetical protein
MVTKSKKSAITESAFDFKTIKTFEDACAKEGINPELSLSMFTEEFLKPITAAYKLMVIYKAINNGWRPDWNKLNQAKYYPWFEVLSSGFGFSGSDYYCDCAIANVGSRLCTDTSEKALYMATQFEEIYKDYFLYSE